MIFPALTSESFFGAMVREPFFFWDWDWDFVRDLLVGFGVGLDFEGPCAILIFLACFVWARVLEEEGRTNSLVVVVVVVGGLVRRDGYGC